MVSKKRMNNIIVIMGCIIILEFLTILCFATLPPKTIIETKIIEKIEQPVEKNEELQKEIENIEPPIIEEQPEATITQEAESKEIEIPQTENIITPQEDVVTETITTVENSSNNADVSTNNHINLGQFKITAYCNCEKCCGKWAGGPTASGVMPTTGRTIATDPKVIPLGTQVIIDGHTYIAEDVGGAIKGNRIDLYFDSHQEALNWGVKYKNVSIIR